MRAAIIIYGLLLCTQLGLAQSTENTDQSDVLGQMEQLYVDQEFTEAYSMLIKHPDICQSDVDLLLKSKILAASSEFNKALFALKQIQGKSLLAEAKNERLRITELSKLDTAQYPVVITIDTNSTVYNDMPFLCNSQRQVLLNDRGYVEQLFPKKIHVQGRFHLSETVVDTSDWYKSIANLHFYELGPSEQESDSLLFITVFDKKPYSGKQELKYDIIVLNLKTSKVEKAFRWDSKSKNMHPTIQGQTIIFSSDMYGGYGGMDLWSAEISENGISSPTNLGASINTPANEVFPKWVNDVLYFASDRTDRGYGGLDIYQTDLKNLALLPYPVNTAYDEYGLFSVSKDSSYFFTNRKGGIGGDDIYSMVSHKKEDFFDELIGKIDTKGIDFSGATIEVSKANGMIAGYATMDEAGYFKLKHVKGNENYELKVIDVELPENSELQLFNAKGDLIKKASLGASGAFAIELLAPIDYYLKRQANEDESVLSIDIEGMMSVNDKPEEGLKIYLEDSNGQLIGVSTTDTRGAFVFDAMKPDDRYVIRSDVQDPNSVIRILAKDGSVIKTIEPGSEKNFVYVRLSDKDQIITITNELNEEVKVSESEQFDLPVIHFELDRSVLNAESEQALNKVIQLLKVNPEINVEISGHTDSRGTAKYNLDLSQERINAVKAYLSISGISRNRFRGKGYGESRLKNKCADGVACSEEEHAENRRTELRVFKSSEL